MTHKTDDIGLPIDPELRRLELVLGYLAAKWRTTWDISVVQEYQQVFKQLYELGWDGVLDLQSELPDEFMPEEYLGRFKSE